MKAFRNMKHYAQSGSKRHGTETTKQLLDNRRERARVQIVEIQNVQM